MEFPSLTAGPQWGVSQTTSDKKGTRETTLKRITRNTSKYKNSQGYKHKHKN